MFLRLVLILLIAAVSSPSSSRLRTVKSSRVKSPAAMASAWTSTDWMARAILRLRKTATKMPTVIAASVVSAIVTIIDRVSSFIRSVSCCICLSLESAIAPIDFLISSVAGVALSAYSFPAFTTASCSLPLACFMAASWISLKTGSSVFAAASRSRLVCTTQREDNASSQDRLSAFALGLVQISLKIRNGFDSRGAHTHYTVLTFLERHRLQVGKHGTQDHKRKNASKTQTKFLSQSEFHFRLQSNLNSPRNQFCSVSLCGPMRRYPFPAAAPTRSVIWHAFSMSSTCMSRLSSL